MKTSPYSMAEALCAFLACYNIKATPVQVNPMLLAHPDYPTLSVLNDTTLEWGLKTEPLMGTVENLEPDTTPAIVFLKSGEYVLMESLENNQVTLLFPGDKRKTLSLQEFSNLWDGTLLHKFPGSTIQDVPAPQFIQSSWWSTFQHTLVWPLLGLFLMGVFFYLLMAQPFKTILLPIGIIKVLGFIICTVLFIGHSEKSQLMQAICPAGKVINCEKVVNSPAGKLFGIPMADLGLLYFAAGFFSLFFSLFSSDFTFTLFSLSVLAMIALPYTLFSISYQAFILHSFCWLCLLIQVIFWLEAFLLYPFIIQGFPTLPGSPLPVIVGFGLSLLLWLGIRPFLKEYPQLKAQTNETMKLRGDPEYIKFQLSQTPKTPIQVLPVDVMLGPVDAPVTLTLVVNPLCRYCGQAYQELKQTIQFQQGNARGIIRFLVGGFVPGQSDTEKSIDYYIALNIAARGITGDNSGMLNALDDWFGHKNNITPSFGQEWRKKYQVMDTVSLKKAEELLRFHEQWALQANINSTPILFMNGLKLQPGIGFKELKYFLLRWMDA